jgi:hypothetical protein
MASRRTIGSAFWGLVLGLLVHQIFDARWSQAK